MGRGSRRRPRLGKILLGGGEAGGCEGFGGARLALGFQYRGLVLSQASFGASVFLCFEECFEKCFG
jgi:hypothetical protein